MKETYSRSKSVWQRMNARERKAAMAYGENTRRSLIRHAQKDWRQRKLSVVRKKRDLNLSIP